MTARTRPALVTAVALLVLALLAGGTAVATGAAKTAARNSVTSKSIKNGTVASKDLKDGSVASADLADGGVGSADLADGSVGSADIANDGLTGADIAEATLGLVPNAVAVGGVQVTPLSLSLASTATATRVLSEAGDYLDLDCGGALDMEVGRAASGPPVVFTYASEGGTDVVDSLGPSENSSLLILDGTFSVAIVVPGGGSVTAEFTGIYETNASGTLDCFYRGTITRVP